MVKVKLKSGYEIYLDGQLIPVLDTLVYNLPNDWDFVILITGDRMVRTGKSVMAMSICAYLADKIGTNYDINNVFFDSQTMMDAAQKMPKNSILHYDEAREGLAAIKTMKTVQQDLIDFFNECGQLNHIFVLVLPDYFSMKEEIAVGRSELLVNVYRRNVKVMRDMYHDGTPRPIVKFERGFFELFNRNKKKTLYDMARSSKRKSYQLIKPNINGRFTNYYPLDQEQYIQKKVDALARFKERKIKEKQEDSKSTKAIKHFVYHWKEKKMTGEEVAAKVEDELGFLHSPQHINRLYQEIKVLNEQQNQLLTLT